MRDRGNVAMLLAASALASMAASSAIDATPLPEPKPRDREKDFSAIRTRERPSVYRKQTPEQRAWNEAVDRKKQDKRRHR